MKLNRLAIIPFFLAILLSSGVFCLLYTTTGLKALAYGVEKFIPGKVIIDKISGNLVYGAKLENITINDEHASLYIHSLTFNLDQRKLFSFAIKVPKYSIEKVDISFNPKSSPLIGDKKNFISSMNGTFYLKKTNFFVSINEITGSWQNESFKGYLSFIKKNNLLTFNKSTFNIANNSITVSTNQDNAKWNIDFKDLSSIHPQLKGKFTATTFFSKTIDLDNIINILPTNEFDNYVEMNEVQFKNNPPISAKIKLSGKRQNHNIMLNLSTNPINKISLNALGKLEDNQWVVCFTKLFSSNKHLNEWNFNDKSYLNIANNNLTADVNLKTSSQNEVYTKFSIKDFLSKGKISGNINMHLFDQSLLMQMFPDISRFKANINATVRFSGTLQKPILSGDLNLQDGTMRIAQLGIKIKPFSANAQLSQNGKLIVKANGEIRNAPGTFNVSGYAYPFKENIPNQFTFIANEMEFINNNEAKLTANSELLIKYLNNSLQLKGDINIISGQIEINDEQSTVKTTKDIVFVNESSQQNTDSLNFTPDINLRIHKNVAFKGFGLDSNISGKLHIAKIDDNYSAQGRISIKSGTYQLLGQSLNISHGRLIYPPGSLINNPTLDIKMLDKNGAGLLIQGNANNPKIENNGLINDQQVLSQILNSTGSPVVNKIQEKFSFEQFGIEDSNSSDLIEDENKNGNLLSNKSLVIGKKLTNKIYLQYLKSLMDNNNAVRVKCALGKFWAIGMESGTNGNGADLSFVIDKN